MAGEQTPLSDFSANHCCSIMPLKCLTGMVHVCPSTPIIIHPCLLETLKNHIRHTMRLNFKRCGAAHPGRMLSSLEQVPQTVCRLSILNKHGTGDPDALIRH
jgi:hypothetical protein